MKKLVFISVSMLMSSISFSQNIVFNSSELYPEGVAFSAKNNSYYVSSLHYGKIGKVDAKGNYTAFVDDADLVSTVGLKADDKRNVLYVCISDPGVSTKTNPATQGKLAKLAVYDLTTGKRKFIADLGALNPTGGNFANDIALDNEGNIYVTNSFSPVIFKITQAGKATVFATSDFWKGEGFNLNGIVYLPNGFLLVAQSNTGNLYKVSIRQPTVITKVETKAIAGADGLVMGNKNELLVISNSAQKVFKLSSNDAWATANQTQETATVNTFPTTGVYVNGNFVVLNAKLNELFDPKAVKTSDFVLQKIK